MTRITLSAAFILLPFTASALQCPDGTWHDLLEHCDMPPSVQCWDGSWRNDLQWCPAEVSDERPTPRPVQEDGE